MHGPEHFLSESMDWEAAMLLVRSIEQSYPTRSVITAGNSKEWAFAALHHAVKFPGSPVGFDLNPDQTTSLLNALWSVMVQTAQQLKEYGAGHTDATPIYSIERRKRPHHGNCFQMVLWMDPPDDAHAELDQMEADRQQGIRE